MAMTIKDWFNGAHGKVGEVNRDSVTVHSSRKQIMILLGTLIALIVADGVISNFLVLHGIAREGNPFLQSWIIEDVFLAIKLLGAFLASVVLWKLYKRHPRVSLTVTICFVILYTFIVFWSLYIFLVAQNVLA